MKPCDLMTFFTTIVTLNKSNGQKSTQKEKLISEQVWFSQDAWQPSGVNIDEQVFHFPAEHFQAQQASEFVWFSEDLPDQKTRRVQTTTTTTTTPPPSRPVFSRFSGYSDLPLFYTYEKYLAVKLNQRRK